MRLAGDKIVRLKEFRPGIYSVAEARREANALLAQLAQGKEIDAILGKSDKYKFKSLFDQLIEQKRRKGSSAGYIAKIINMVSTYILPKLGDRDVKSIKRDELLEIFKAMRSFFDNCIKSTNDLIYSKGENNEDIISYHIPITDAIKDRDPSVALVFMERHFKKIREVMQK